VPDESPSRTSSYAWRTFVAPLLLIAAIGGAGRVAYVMTKTRHEHTIYDYVYYVSVANSIAAGDGFIDALGVRRQAAPHPPLTVLVLAPVAKVWGPEDMHAVGFRIVMSAFGALTIIVVGLLARELAGRRAGLLAAAFVAVTPAFWMNDGLVMSETLSALTTALVLLFAYRVLRGGGRRDVVALGVACGLAMLARSELALLVLFVALPATLLSSTRALRERILRFAIVGCVAALVVGPWVGYNLSRFNRPVFLSTGDGAVLAGANCPAAYSGPLAGMWAFSCVAHADGPAHGDVSDASSRAVRVGVRYIKAHKGRALTVAALRVGRVWGLYAPFQTAHLAEGRPNWAANWGVWWFWAFAPVALAGGFVARRRSIPLAPLVGVILMVTVGAVLFWGSLRFRVPAEVAIAALVALALDALVGRVVAPTSASRPAEVTDAGPQRGGDLAARA
jgi:4-amino-4-deoxy-L-arabinose transferase-like glycosyltransferase